MCSQVEEHDKHSAGWLTHQFASSVFVENVVLSMYENWARCTKTGQLRSFGENGINLNIRRSRGQSFYILTVSKWAIFIRNFTNFHLTDEKI